MKRPPHSESCVRNSGTLLSCAFAIILFSAAAAALCAAVGSGKPQPAAFGILFVVDSTGDGDNVPLTGSNCDDGTGNCTLRAAIRSANNSVGTDDTIVFNIPTAQPWIINLTKALPDISDSVNISGPGADKLTVENPTSQQNYFRIFNVTTSGTVNLSGLTMYNPRGSHDNGGAIQNYNAGTVNVTKCAFNASAFIGDGGGIYNRVGGTVNVTNCRIGAYADSNGGGIYNSGTGHISVTSSELTAGTGTGSGGGIYNLGTMSVINTTLLFCEGSDGGAIYNGGTMTVTNSALDDNKAYVNGGGIYNADFATMNVINSTIWANTVDAQTSGSNGNGGGIHNKGTLNVSNSTIADNTCAFLLHGIDTFGGGIYNDSQATGNATVKSTIIALNSSHGPCADGYNAAGSFISQGFNLVGETDGSTGFSAATDQTGTCSSSLDPMLDLTSRLRNNGGPTETVALLTGSPAIDKGTSNGLTGTLTTDQRGVGYERTIDKSVANATGGEGTDIGAFEFGAKIKAVSSKTHGTAGSFTVNLPLFGPKLGVECRDGGASGVFKVILTFPSAVTVSDASVSPDPAAAGATASVSSFSVSGSKVTVNLTGVSKAQRIDVNLLGVSNGSVSNDVRVPMGVLLGDTNGDRSVTTTDVNLTQSKVGQAVTKSTFREDVTVDGSIDSNDVNLVQSKIGTKLP